MSSESETITVVQTWLADTRDRSGLDFWTPNINVCKKLNGDEIFH